MLFAEALALCLPFDEGFGIVTSQLERGDERYLRGNITALLFFQHGRTLDWIETVQDRVVHVTSDWGHLVACSRFTWIRARRWLEMGRPLSLMALDALYFCVSENERNTQSLITRRINPTLSDAPAAEVMAELQVNHGANDPAPEFVTKSGRFSGK